MTPREPLTLEVGKKVKLRNGWTDTITSCAPDSEWPWGGSLGSWTDSGKHYTDDNLDILHVLAKPADEVTKLRKALEVAVEYMRHCYEADFDGHPVHDHIALCESVLESTKGSR